MTRGLWALLLCLLLAPLARADDEVVTMDACECRDCLKLMKLSTLNERQIYDSRLPAIKQTLQEEIDRYNSNAEYRKQFDGIKRVHFCFVESMVEDELQVIRDYKIQDELKKVFAGKESCLPKVGGSTNPADCQIDNTMMMLTEVTSPCDAVYLAILAHELVHVKDCQARKTKPDWLKSKGDSCNDAYSGKTPPRTELLLTFVQELFDSELHAHKVESEVEALLINELNKQCSPNDYSARMTKSPKYKEAVTFLQRARNYKFPAQK